MKEWIKEYSVYFLLVVIIFSCKPEEKVMNASDGCDIQRGDYRIMFYNTENLFDTFDDSLKNDGEFLPDGQRYWSKKRYYEKLNHICKVITAVGGWELPEVIGLCEVENRYVLEGITKFTALEKFRYRIIHKESPDSRGIDVGLLYLEDRFKPLDFNFYKVVFSDSSGRATRDILYVKGKTLSNDTLHIFINHWPSRYGGQLESEVRRYDAALTLRHVVDSIFNSDKDPLVIITGDFNDEPDDLSISKYLGAIGEYDDIHSEKLYNISAGLKRNGKGSHKYQGDWGMLDQFIVSGALLLNTDGIASSTDDVHVFNADFLLEDDDAYMGKRPFRTYLGFRYIGGFSDHLPVFIDLGIKKMH